ncbi:pericentriolar material 1 protein-like isoform X2 [Anneissia japonica]|uniref:pericentriolar material 1 protein-like isoform X2 n=1 Tax=Anneissia japonica TaxID=1529436 RepID=UPI0014255702|nr:pericentriolar material 1 protein-like isoform X2 [Anneissia japonica]
MASEHEQLKSKLEDLQEKKEQMDQLLLQLKSLRPQALNNDGDSMSASSMNVLDVVSQATSATEEARSETSQQAISDDKLRRLQEMRERLNQLRDLVQYYQASQEEERAGAGDAPAAAAAMPEHEPSLSSVNFEDPRLMSNLRLLQRGENIASHSGSGLNADEENDNEDEEDDDEDDASESCTTEATENNETTGETTTEDETESNQSSIMARWGDDPEIREKVRKLQSAKAKLRQLQDLVAMVQHTPEFAGSLPNDLAELAMSIDEEASDQQSNAAAGTEALRAFTEETREAYYEVKMKQQKKELENLMQERQRLLQVQNQLKDLNENPTPRKTLSAGKKTTAVQAGNPLLEAAKLMEENKLATPTRDEIYAEMRRHKILQEELRQKRHELEELLSGTRSTRINFDDLERAAFSVQSENDNDLFSRVSMRSADITAAATWGSSTQEGSLQDEMENAEDEDFQGDGIIQVEEEEEEVQSEALSSDTYTIEAQYRQRQRQLPSLDRPSLPSLDRPSVSHPRWSLPQDSDSDAARHGIRYPTSPRYRGNPVPEYKGLTQSARKRQENIRSAEDLMADDPASTAEETEYLKWKSVSLERQLSASVNMCHDLLRDQHNMSNLLQTSMTGNWGYPSQSPMARNPYMNSPSNPMNDMLANYNMRLQHQQLMLNLNQTYGQLYALQEDIRNFEEMAKQEGSVNEENLPSSNYPYGPSPGISSLGSMQSQYAQPHFPGMSYPPYGMNQYPPAYGLNASYTIPPYTSPALNPYAMSTSAYDPVNSIGNQRAREARPRFNMNSVLNPQEHDEVPPNSELDDDQLGPSISNREASFNLDLQSHLQPNLRPRTTGLFGSPAADDDSLTTPVATASKTKAPSAVPPLNIDSLLKKMDRQRRRPGSESVTSTSSKGATKRGSGLMAKAREMAKDHSRKGASGGPRPGLSSSLSGTAFFDAASVTSTVSASSMPGELVNGEFFLPGERRRGTVKTQHEVESDIGSEFSLFEALRETIYSEVATLISQNETRPHYLIELFRELQMLSSDYLRQRALYALQDLVSKYLTDEAIAASNVASTSHSVPPWQIPTASEHTPSESLLTSEDDEMKARLYSQHPPKKNGSSVKSGEYDYMEHVESASTMSTPNSTHEFGFANDDLGDTVIHLDKALRRMREYERMKAEQEGTSSAVSSSATAELHKKEGPQTSTDATSNSSAQDVGSESSFSSLPYPRIDTRQLDHQIKSIMQEVIPCLKEHIDDVCSSELLAYLRRLVLTLTRQRDDSQEFVRFFNKQLGSILQDSLAKFAGRKMRECGEDLLVDISEILFNELAFFRLMQDLDTSGSNLRMNAERASETGTDTGTGVDEEEEGDSSSSEESSDEEDTEAAEEEEEEDKGDDLTKASLETAMASYSKIEEEDLGKARDDEMAADLGISDQDE